MRSYSQFCPLASALDSIGDRWTLLIVRELLFLGPRRFTDLAEGLPGIAPNLLSSRLGSLQEAGIIERGALSPPGKAVVYLLTEHGEGLREPVLSLMRWGAPHIEPPGRGESVRPEFLVMALNAAVTAERAAGADMGFELTVDDVSVLVRVRDGRVELHGVEAPAVRVSMTMAVFVELLQGRLDLMEAAMGGAVTVDGSPEEVEQLLDVFGVAEPVTP